MGLWTTCVRPVYFPHMTALSTVVVQLVLLALGAVCAVLAASFARRAASFDIGHDFEALAHAVAKLQRVARSEHMTRVRAAAVEPQQPAAAITPTTPMPKDQLRALARAKHHGGTQ